MEQNGTFMRTLSKTDPQRQAQYPQSAGRNFEKKKKHIIENATQKSAQKPGFLIVNIFQYVKNF